MKYSCIAASLALSAIAASAQDTTKVHRDSIAKLGTVKVTAERTDAGERKPIQSLTLPVSASITASKVEQTVNAVDAEDAVKYLPSVFLRKRNNGDTQATMGTRVWGVSSSARSLIYADGVPLTALIANNNNIGGPRWGLVSPSEIARIDMMYGPFSAAYAGNSMGAVMEITTKMPTQFGGSLMQTQAMQRFDLYGTQKSYGTMSTSGDIGGKVGNLGVLLSGMYEDSHSQPLSYVTSGTFPTGTTGGYADANKLGAAANVLGASGLLHTGMTNGKAKLAYDITPTLRAAYTFGYWRNNADAGVESYIAKSSTPTFAGQAGFASGYYSLLQQHSSHSVSIRTDRHSDWDFEAVGATYRFDKDEQRTPTSASSTDASYGAAGRVALLDGTGWKSLDLKAAWHHDGALAMHTVTFGAHADAYQLNNPTWNTTDFRNGAFTTLATEGDGKTRTNALWAQDAWRITDRVKLTVGGRYEDWRAYDGYNVNGATAVRQTTQSATRFSPKGILAWTPTVDWLVTASAAKAYRFATAAELYQLVTTGTTFTSPDPNLKPDNDLSTELRVQRGFSRGRVQAALFQDDVHDAIISQFLPLVANSTTLYSYISNVDHVRARGVELTGSEYGVLLSNLELSASATYLDAKTLELSGRASATAPAGSAIGKQLPNIPKWRGNFSGTYHQGEKLAMTVGGRYSGLVYTTLDNADVNPNTYQGFSEWFVMDAKVNYKLDQHLSLSLGADNLLDRKYFLFHPFPQRTFIGSAKVSF